MSVYQFKAEQKIPATVIDVWDFISSPKNLKRITPDKMGFDIISDNLSDKMYPGMIISYKVKPIGNIKMSWTTEITHIEEGKFFVDEQREGPYKIWHHEHHIKSIDGGVFMEDLVTYQPPFGFIGRLSNQLFIRKKIEEIFDYRRNALIEIFGSFNKEKH